MIDSFRSQDSSFITKVTHVFALNYPMRWNLQKELAELWKTMGCHVAAFELFYEIRMIEEGITSLFAAGR